MEYEKYYADVNEEQEQRPRGKRIAVSIIASVLVLSIVCLLVAGLVQSIQSPWTPPEDFLFPQRSPSAGVEYTTPQPVAAPTPFPTERPMASLDGVAPAIPYSGNPMPDIVDAVSPGVIGVYNYGSFNIGDDVWEEEAQGVGSGFLVSSDGYVLTNAHVVQDASAVTVMLADGQELEAELIGVDEESDVAVLKIENPGLKPLKLGDSTDIRVGEYVLAVGNPLNLDLGNTVTYGIISALSRTITIDDQPNVYIQTDAAINVGNSGGPLLNMEGEVIGINTAKTLNAGYDEYGMPINAEGLGFALPITRVKYIMEQLITKGVVRRAGLGVKIRQMTKPELNERGIESGVLIQSVVRGGPASVAGLQPGDIVISCDGVACNSTSDLSEYVNMQQFGTRILMDVWRDGKTQTLPVDLVDMESLDYSDADDLEEESVVE